MCLLVLASCLFSLMSADKRQRGTLTDLVTPFQGGPDLCYDWLVMECRKKEGDTRDVPFTNFASFVCCSSYSYSACVSNKMYDLHALRDKYLPSKAPLPLEQLHFRTAYHARSYALPPVGIGGYQTTSEEVWDVTNRFKVSLLLLGYPFAGCNIANYVQTYQSDHKNTLGVSIKSNSRNHITLCLCEVMDNTHHHTPTSQTSRIHNAMETKCRTHFATSSPSSDVHIARMAMRYM